MRKSAVWFALWSAVFVLVCMVFAEVPESSTPSRAYVGHENDRDMQSFVRQYPQIVGTRLDDCQSCHRGGLAGTDTEREYSPCGYCHLLEFPNGRYKTGVPKNYEDTLNAYGLAYKKAGRSVEALSMVAAQDSDGDKFSNAQEIANLKYPGDSASRPGQPLAPILTMHWNDIQNLPRITQFLLMNTTSEPFDDYTSYTGVRVRDLLQAAKVDLKGATGITVFAPDGYSVDYSIADIMNAFPKPYFYEAPRGIKDKEKMFVHYPDRIPEGVEDGKEISMAPWLLLAIEREGKPLDAAQYEKGTGRLTGEGPYRLIRPQRDAAETPYRAGRPDRSVRSKTFGDEWDYAKAMDHNAGACVRGTTAIRINPMPAGYEEYDWKNGWPLVGSRQIVIFGRGVSQ